MKTTEEIVGYLTEWCRDKIRYSLAILAFLLFACANEKTEKIFDFKCDNKQNNHILNIQYDRLQSKLKLISYERIKQGDEKIIGKEFNTFEKEEEVLAKIPRDWDMEGGDAFLNLKSGELKIVNIEDGKETKDILNCKRI